MVITAILAAVTIWGLLYGQMNPFLLSVVSILMGLTLGVLGQHGHYGILSVDSIAQHSRFVEISPILKTWGCLTLLAICVSSGIVTGFLLAGFILFLNLYASRLHIRDYLSMLAIPANFLLLSCLALLFEWSHEPTGTLNISIFGGWFCAAADTQARTVTVLARALGAMNCLYLLSLSTPISEIIGVLRRAHVPSVVTDLMYLIYRYLFLLLEIHSTMRDAAESRLGFHGFSQSIRCTGMLYTNLLVRSFQKANSSFDAMESRCYEGEIRFLTKVKPLTAKHLMAAAAILGFAFIVGVWERIM